MFSLILKRAASSFDMTRSAAASTISAPRCGSKASSLMK